LVRPRTLAVLAALAAACAGRAAPGPAPSPREPTVWVVGVVTGSGGRLIAESYTLRAVPRGGGVWAFMTDHASGTIEEGAAALTWDSADPRPEDPWPLVVQHAISSVPAQIQLDDRGRPERLVDPEAWERAARASIADRGLPEQARSSIGPLLDPEGVVRDLRRTLPGLPPDDGPWVRDEQVAGLVVRRTEQCAVELEGRRRAWRCEGTLASLGDVAAKLFDGTSTTRLVIDARGLVELTSTYEATLVYVDATGQRAVDRPVAGRRQVLRRAP
jgi:hypothetical protein